MSGTRTSARIQSMKATLHEDVGRAMRTAREAAGMSQRESESSPAMFASTSAQRIVSRGTPVSALIRSITSLIHTFWLPAQVCVQRRAKERSVVAFSAAFMR